MEKGIDLLIRGLKFESLIIIIVCVKNLISL